MIKHIFLLLWNQKKKYTVILLEQMLVFVILMICVTSLLTTIKKYNSQGLLNTQNTIYFGYMLHTSYTYEDIEQVERAMNSGVIAQLKKYPYVEGICESVQFIPYTRPAENFWEDSVKISPDKKIWAKTKGTDAGAYNVFKLNLAAGRWFEDGERPDGFDPAVVTSQFVDKAGMSAPIGQTVQIDSRIYKIVGVLAGLKESVFSESPVSIIVPVSSWKRIGFYGEYAARIKPGHEDDFYSDYYKELRHSSIDFGLFEPVLSKMEKWKNGTMIDTITEEAFMAIPTLFLVIFAIIGTMGLWLLDVKKHIPEFAVRIAIGSTRKELGKMVFIQNLVISLIAAIPGLILVFFIYEFRMIEIMGIGASLLVMLLFSVFSAWYPAYMAFKINPAEALQYE